MHLQILKSVLRLVFLAPDAVLGQPDARATDMPAILSSPAVLVPVATLLHHLGMATMQLPPPITYNTPPNEKNTSSSMPELVTLLTKGRLDAPGAGMTFSSVEIPTCQFAGDLAAQFAATSLGHPVFGAAVALQMQGGGSADAAEVWRSLSSHRALLALPSIDVVIGGSAAYLTTAAQFVKNACACSRLSRHQADGSELHVNAASTSSAKNVITPLHGGGAHPKEQVARHSPVVEPPMYEGGSCHKQRMSVNMPPGLQAVAEGFEDKRMWHTNDPGSAPLLVSVLQRTALLAYMCHACALLVTNDSGVDGLPTGSLGASLLQPFLDDLNHLCCAKGASFKKILKY
jgi:hypothetical protein